MTPVSDSTETAACSYCGTEHHDFTSCAMRCDGCGESSPEHWREGGWYCDSCAACEVCGSPYCGDPEHR